jgi:malonate-semialdehyde dehydrogenase (acetylating)/methylmalonate-semialdehyde dehydrogenase
MMAQHPSQTGVLGTSSSSFPSSHAKIANPKDTPYFIDNEFRFSATKDLIDVHDPATNELVSKVPKMTESELEEVLQAAETAFPAWKGMSTIARQQIMFRFVGLIREHWDRLAAVITLEQGKTLADSKGDVLRGLQVAEAACAGPEYMKGEVLEVAKDMETRTYREPLGVVGVICPFSKLVPDRF